jgi:hypothetical protein
MDVKSKKEYRDEILEVANKLAEKYPETPFENHCYMRIAFDKVAGCKWDTIYHPPAYRSMTFGDLDLALMYLKGYLENPADLLVDNIQSLGYRRKALSRQLKAHGYKGLNEENNQEGETSL